MKDLQSDDKDVRSDFLLSLTNSELAKEKKVNALQQGLQDQHDSVRISAVQTIQKLEYQELFDDLQGVFSQEKIWLVRYYVLKALFKLDKKKAQETIRKALTDIKPKIRTKALELFSIETEEDVKQTIKLTRDKDPSVRDHAFKALKDSEHPSSQDFIADYNAKLKAKEEKEKKMKELLGEDGFGDDLLSGNF